MQGESTSRDAIRVQANPSGSTGASMEEDAGRLGRLGRLCGAKDFDGETHG